MKKILALGAFLASMTIASTASACGGFLQAACTGSASDTAVAEQLEGLVSQGVRQVPMPAITNFFERQMVKMIYELRDNPEYQTYTYFVTLNGTFVYICDSVGYGINSSIQYASPVKLENEIDLGQYSGSMALPQAEPNALFMPEGLAATYVICAFDPNTGPVEGDLNLYAVYMEQDAFVTPFKVPSAINPYE